MLTKLNRCFGKSFPCENQGRNIQNKLPKSKEYLGKHMATSPNSVSGAGPSNLLAPSLYTVFFPRAGGGVHP